MTTRCDALNKLFDPHFQLVHLDTYESCEICRASINHAGAHCGEPRCDNCLFPRQAAFLFLRRPEKLRVEEQEVLARLRQLHSEVDLAYDLVLQFAQMLRNRTGDHLDAWLAQVEESKLPEFQSFATGIEKDKKAVRAGLT